jgi:hypothetical protein
MKWHSTPPAGSFVNRHHLVSAVLSLFAVVPSFDLQAVTPSPPRVGLKTSQISVVDIIPESLSGETDDDREPNIAVNPARPLQIAASAFTREPLRRADRAPIFVSINGGQNWSCRSIVPSPEITCDITLRFGSSSDVLYVSALRNQIQGYEHPELIVCQSARYANTRVMDEVFNRRKDIDQPYIAAMTVGSKDCVFVGDNDFNYHTNGVAAIDRSLDSPNGHFTPFSIESRNAYLDSSEVRPAITADGAMVYAVFNRVTCISDDQIMWTSDVVIVRDDNGGASKPPFSSLIDPEDGLPGARVVKQRTFAWDKCLGGDRLGGDLAMAVHPGNKNKVYLVWSDWTSDRVSLHLKYSTDGGQNWSDNKRDIPDAKNPGVAVNAQGTVGFLYQQVVNTPEGYMWETQFEQTTDDFETPAKLVTLAKFPSGVPVYSPGECHAMLLGDYLHLMSVDNDFYGIFSSNNDPDRSHFPSGVKFQRRESGDHKKLLDLQGHDVTASIDPFFFKVTER